MRSIRLAAARGADERGARGRTGEPGVAPIEWLALAGGLLPVVTICIWAVAVDWVPLGDSGQLAVRSRDVFTADHPFVGAWSSASNTIDEDVNNLGALHLVLLAPFTRLDPYWGTAVGMTVLNSAAVVGVWAAARSVLGRLGVVGAMLATLALVASMGNVALLQTRQQLGMLLPFWCLVWVSMALWRGRAWAAPAVVVLASLLIQTHFTFIIQSVAIVAAATIAFSLQQRGRWRQRDVGRPLLVAGALGVACWAPTLWDQVYGRGNLGTIATEGGGRYRLGIGPTVELVSHTVLGRAFWMPGSMAGAEQADPLIAGTFRATWTSWLVVSAWAAVVVGTWAWARATDHRGIAALAGVGTVTLGSAMVATDRIHPGQFGVHAPQNYFWLWAVALTLALVPAAAVASLLQGRAAVGRRVRGALSAVTLVAAAAGSSLVISHLSVITKESFSHQSVARSLIEQLGHGLDDHSVEGPVLIDYAGGFLTPHRYTFLAELQRRGIPFTFRAGTTDVLRFGLPRCADQSVDRRLSFANGPLIDQDPGEGAILLARIDSTPQRRVRLEALDREVGEELRSGALEVDLDQLRSVDRATADDVAGVLRDDGRSASGLASGLAIAESTGAIRVSSRARSLVDRWRQTADDVARDQVSIHLMPEGDLGTGGLKTEDCR